MSHKLSKRTFLTAILAMLFAVCAALGVYFLLPKTAVYAEEADDSAKVNSYDELKSALEGTSDTITLTGDIENTSSDVITVSRSVTIDGGGHTISSSNAKSVIEVVGSGVTVTIQNVTLTTTYTTVDESIYDSGRAITVNLSEGNVTLNVENSTLNASVGSSGYGSSIMFVGKSNTNRATANVSNSTLTATDGHALRIYAPADIRVEDSTLSGWSIAYFQANNGASSAGSTLTIIDSTMTATGRSGSGNHFGAFVFNYNVDITVDGGSISYSSADTNYEVLVFYRNGANGGDISITNCTVKRTGSYTNVYATNNTTVSAGNNEFLGLGTTTNFSTGWYKAGITSSSNGNGTYTAVIDTSSEAGSSLSIVAKTTKAGEEEASKSYTDLQTAIDLAANGSTVALSDDLTASITVDEGKELTLDLNGYTLTNSSTHTIINYGTLTITDNSADNTGTVDNVTHGCGALVNYGTATLSGGTFTRSKEAGTYDPYQSNGNSWYTLKNYGYLIINEGATVTTRLIDESNSQNSVGGYSSLINNGYFNDNDYSTNNSKVTVAENAATIVINGGTFEGGINTLKNDEGGTAIINGGTFTNVTQATIQNWNTLTITGGTFNAEEDNVSAVITGKTTSSIGSEGSTTITGGTFNGAVTYIAGYSGGITYSISGGIFSNVSEVAGYLDDDYVIYYDSNGTYTVVSEDDFDSVSDNASVAQVGSVYGTLQDAISAAAEDDTVVTLLKDVTLESSLKITGSVTIDLNGYKISYSGTAVYVTGTTTEKGITVSIKNGCVTSVESYAVWITENANVAFDNVTIYGGGNYGIAINTTGAPLSTYPSVVTVTNSKITGAQYAGVVVFGIDVNSTACNKVTKFIAEDTVITGYYFGVSGNGGSQLAETYIELINCTIESEGTGIYQPQAGTLIVNGGSITALTGIEIRAGKVTIEDVDITATGDPFGSQGNSGGTTTTGAAIAVVQHTTKLPINVTIAGGTFTGARALYEANLQNNDACDIAKVSIAVQDGEFNGEVYSEDLTAFISGGTFSEGLDESYIEDDCALEYNVQTGMYVVLDEEKGVPIATARANAQADVRDYMATNGWSWSYINSLAADDSSSQLKEEAQSVIAAYKAIEKATSEYGVATARLAAMDAVDNLVSAFDDLKSAAIEALEDAAYGTTEDGEDKETGNSLNSSTDIGTVTSPVEITIPTNLYLAIYSATTEEELNLYLESAIAEISAIRSYLTEIRGQSYTLADLANTLGDLEDILSLGESGYSTLLEAIQAAITEAQNAITGVEEGSGDSTSLADIQQYLEGVVSEAKAAIDAIYGKLAEWAGEVDGIGNLMESLLGKADEYFEDLVTDLKGAIEEAQEAIMGTDETSISDAVNTINGKTADLISELQSALLGENGTLTTISSTLETIEAALGNIGEDTAEITSIAAQIEDVRAALTALTTTGDGTTYDLEDIVTAISGVGGTVEAAQKAIEEKIETIQTNLDGKLEELQGSLKTANDSLTGLGGDIAEIAAQIAAAQTSLDGLTTSVAGLADESDLTAAVESILTELASVESDIADITSALGASAETDDSLQAAVSDAQSGIMGMTIMACIIFILLLALVVAVILLRRAPKAPKAPKTPKK